MSKSNYVREHCANVTKEVEAKLMDFRQKQNVLYDEYELLHQQLKEELESWPEHIHIKEIKLTDQNSVLMSFVEVPEASVGIYRFLILS